MNIGRGSSQRRGYSLTVVLIFVILLFFLWSVVYQTTSSMLRVQTSLAIQQIRDQGAMNALAQAVQLLQYGNPQQTYPQNNVFTYEVLITQPDTSGNCQQNPYVVIFTYQGSGKWQIEVYPGPAPGSTPTLPTPTNLQW